jgi:hypothetical protein
MTDTSSSRNFKELRQSTDALQILLEQGLGDCPLNFGNIVPGASAPGLAMMNYFSMAWHSPVI